MRHSVHPHSHTAGGFPVNATAQRFQQTDVKPTIVLVHGAFADASSWNGVVERLQQQGYTVVAPANPLRGLAADSAYIASVVNQIDGPVLLVGHSYGGGRPARKRRPRRLLDLHLYQLAPYTSLRPRVGREVQGARVGGDRCAHTGVLIRGRRRQCSPRRQGHAGRLSDRHRQTTMRSGVRSGTIIGRSCISSMRRDISDITTSARANTNRQR
jgi:pimeloyl-ACP methyl ester carboxylesterase